MNDRWRDDERHRRHGHGHEPRYWGRDERRGGYDPMFPVDWRQEEARGDYYGVEGPGRRDEPRLTPHGDERHWRGEPGRRGPEPYGQSSYGRGGYDSGGYGRGGGYDRGEDFRSGPQQHGYDTRSYDRGAHDPRGYSAAPRWDHDQRHGHDGGFGRGEPYRADRDWRGYGRNEGRHDERGFLERAGDEVRTWFGDEEAERRRRYDEQMRREEDMRLRDDPRFYENRAAPRDRW